MVFAFLSKVITSALAYPGAMMVLRGLDKGDMLPMPAEMRFE